MSMLGKGNGGVLHDNRTYMSKTLWNIAKKLPPNERVEIKKKSPKAVKSSQLSDEQAKDVIRKNMMGLPIAYLAKITGFSDACIKGICTGINRSHLMREVEEEMRNQNK